MTHEPYQRRLAVGAECAGKSGVDFRVWAPRRRQVAIVLVGGPGEGTTHECEPEVGGYFHARVSRASAGTRYRMRLDRESHLYPDPASRAQPEGPHGPSEVIDPETYDWRDRDWRGMPVRSPMGPVPEQFRRIMGPALSQDDGATGEGGMT